MAHYRKGRINTMKYKADIGFIMALLGMGGISEAYGNAYQTTISALLILVGGILLYRGLSDEKKNNDKHCRDTGNVLNRLYFLCK